MHDRERIAVEDAGERGQIDRQRVDERHTVGIGDLDQTLIDLYLDDVLVARQGGRNPDYREEDGQRVMQQAEITVRVLLGRGEARETVWTCDLSHDYVSINADYRS